MKVLLTGSGGYIGIVTAPYLIERGHEVVGVDTGYYESGWLFHSGQRQPALIVQDIRRLTVSDLVGFDAVVHMAELSNDPLGQLNRELTFQINHQGSVKLAQAAKAAGVTRFVYMSSCSVYGIGEEGEIKTEESPVNPQTAYAECKVLVERDLAQLADDSFSPVFLRNATAFGPSPRQRFDVVLNNLAGLAWTTGKIAMVSDGTPWRPLVHILDIAHAVACALEAPREAIHNQVFNVGDSRYNYRVREIAEIVAEVFPGCELTFGRNDGDNRSYRVDFSKIATRLPGFACRYDAVAGARQLRAVFERIGMTREIFEAPPYTRLKMLRHLIATNQLDAELFWRS
ncbi:MAG TPA: NAD-dependent dehydratase [Chloroflexus aurantiacus]|jgi:nucleoside-diphosphate-sugar epimerase|uniref:NAD-dependent epimerase/dehydratase n=1 Tax=Chloroflexus aurantiacus (strain ATCC 29366 / DSM 635 / J-10-fl) TaxID=324602 RepID=A9WJZ3_CHLAA|nr:MULTISPECIES: SDR family oxidoreductase [Chloroflexus]ABY34444.1 NAD-dependent epimerase/dehydratase [Chloroflexus aurantiacus J-10-fl]RMG48769.1 MAG: SDR family oxidoreductase [Chloroflexota bacterium]HBW68079.1 NAD-dependent dehydratase [Chloroflexus aurantiacus]